MTEADTWQNADFDCRAGRAAPAEDLERSATSGPNVSPGNSAFSNKDKRNLAAISKAARKMMLKATLVVGMRSVQVLRRVTGGDA